MLYFYACKLKFYSKKHSKRCEPALYCSQPLIISRKCPCTLRKGRKKQRQGADMKRAVSGGFKPFQKEKSWNEDVKFHFHSISFSSYSSWQLHVLHKHSIRTRIQSGAVLGLKCSKWISKFPNIWNIIENIPLHESQSKTGPSGIHQGMVSALSSRCHHHYWL